MSGSSAHELGQAVGSTLGVVLLVVVPIAIGYFVARRMNAKREGYDPARWPIAVGAVLSLLMLVGQCSAPRAAERTDAGATANRWNPQISGRHMLAHGQGVLCVRGFVFRECDR